MKKKQIDQEGYLEGLHTGMKKGYDKGIKDSVRIIQSLLDDNGVHMRESEFYIQMQTMLESGEITPYDFKFDN